MMNTEVEPRRFRAPCITALAFLAYWLLDHAPRFYLGDSTAYLSTGTSGWIPPDRSWAYGFASRWVVQAAGRVDALAAAQCLLLGLAILAARRLVEKQDRRAALAFCALAALDPLMEAYTRFWLSDAVALACFLLVLRALDRFVAPGARRILPGLLGLAAVAFLAFSVRLAYVPVAFAVCLGCVALSFRPGTGIARRRALAACLAVPLAVLAVAGSNAVVSMPRFRGTPFLNKMSGLYELGVFTPAVRLADINAAGIPMTQAAFDAMALGRYDNRPAEVWSDDPHYLRAYLQKASGYDDVYDPRFQALCHRIVSIGMAHHPQSFVASYLYGLALYLTPKFYVLHFNDEMGLNKDLPAWSVDFLRSFSHSDVSTQTPRAETPLIGLLRAAIPAYFLIMIAGFGCAVLVLCSAGRPRGQSVLALALVFSLLATPVYSHDIKPRYVLAVVALSYAMFACVLQGRRPNRAVAGAADRVTATA